MAIVLGTLTYKDFAGVSKSIRTLIDNGVTPNELMPGGLLFDHLGQVLTIDAGGGLGGALKAALMTAPQVIGYDAHDGAVDANNRPVRMGAVAKAGLSGLTLVAADDISGLMADLDGALVARHQSLADIVSGNASNTDGTTTSVIASSGAGIKTYLSWVTLVNTHATTFAYVEMKDGTTVKATIPVPPSGGAIFQPPTPIPGSAATAWFFDPSAAVTTLICSAGGFKSKV